MGAVRDWDKTGGGEGPLRTANLRVMLPVEIVNHLSIYTLRPCNSNSRRMVDSAHVQR
jgi:hypothetical protein